MGKLFIMPSHVPAEALPVDRNERQNTEKPPAALPERLDGIDFDVWLSAPRERTSRYFPVYSTVSLAMQTALRHWAREWLHQHPEAFRRPTVAYSLLVFSCTRPYRGRPPHIFTYDLQQAATLDQALRAARRLLAEELKRIDEMRWSAGYHETPNQVSRQVQSVIARNRRLIYRMFHVETALMDEVLKFTQINIPKLGLDRAVAELRSGFRRNLRRFSDLVDFDERTEDLLSIITDALCRGFDDGSALPVAA